MYQNNYNHELSYSPEFNSTFSNQYQANYNDMYMVDYSYQYAYGYQNCNFVNEQVEQYSYNPHYNYYYPVQSSPKSFEQKTNDLGDTLNTYNMQPTRANRSFSQNINSNQNTSHLNSSVEQAHQLSYVQKENLSPVSNSSSQNESYSNLKRNRSAKQLPEDAVDLLNEWFESHLNHPYPSNDEKQRLADKCGITVKQVNSWFCNRRNRSQNTKPKRIKKQLEQQITNVFNELAVNPNKTQVIEKFKSCLKMHDIALKNN